MLLRPPFHLILGFLTISLLGASGTASADEPRNAREFLNLLSEKPTREAQKPDALSAAFTEEALAGIQTLQFTKKITEAETKKLNQALTRAKLYTVNFALCVDDTRSDCAPSVGYVAKNYPDAGVILIDGSDHSARWRNLRILERREIAVHEFAGLAGIEIENHALSTQIDDARTFEQYESENDLKRYFKLLNDLYFILPGAPSYIYQGSWALETSLQPNGKRTNERKPGEPRSIFSMNLAIRSSHSNQDPGLWENVTNPDTSELYPPKDWTEPSDITIFGESGKDGKDYSSGPFAHYSLTLSHGEVMDREAYLSRRNSGRTKSVLKPSVGRDKRKRIPEISCKALNEDLLLCREIFDDYNNVAGILLSMPKTRYHYNFYSRASARKIPNRCPLRLRFIGMDGKEVPPPAPKDYRPMSDLLGDYGYQIDRDAPSLSLDIETTHRHIAKTTWVNKKGNHEHLYETGDFLRFRDGDRLVHDLRGSDYLGTFVERVEQLPTFVRDYDGLGHHMRDGMPKCVNGKFGPLMKTESRYW